MQMPSTIHEVDTFNQPDNPDPHKKQKKQLNLTAT